MVMRAASHAGTKEETHAAISEASDELQRELAETMKRRIEGMGQ